MPKPAVITPNYNQARYLPQRLHSILAQDYKGFEQPVLEADPAPEKTSISSD
jgi:hypothetical protein